jgi:hypothetical protein
VGLQDAVDLEHALGHEHRVISLEHVGGGRSRSRGRSRLRGSGT